MRNWWVNQNQTYLQEIAGGYMWSPKVNKNGNLNPFYEFMREVAPGDLIFSFADTRIRAIGIALSPCYDCAKPSEFGAAGRVWGDAGWRVDVRWRELRVQIKPKDHMELLSPFLPAKYSPLQSSGQGLQSVYLTGLPDSLADALVQLIGAEAVEGRQIARSFISDITDPRLPAQAQAEWEEDLARRVEQDTQISVTEKRQVILARRGQGKFRERVSMIERACRITQVNRPEHLIASHCKPWRDCESNDERLDGENGLLLTPTVDHLFDRGFISFENQLRFADLACSSLDNQSRKHLRQAKAGHASQATQQLRTPDKLRNVREILADPPAAVRCVGEGNRGPGPNCQSRLARRFNAVYAQGARLS